jgi:hypothetical protein
MNLLIAYLVSVLGLVIRSKNIQWLCVLTSIVLYLVVTSFFEIGGDYKSLQARADKMNSGMINWSLDLVFLLLSQISMLLKIDVPILYAVTMLGLLPYHKNKPMITLFALVVTFYFVITGFQRQALAGFILLTMFRSNNKLIQILGIIISFLTHSSIILISAIALTSKKLNSVYRNYLLGVGLFVAIISLSVILEGTFLNHFIQYYFTEQMQSAGAKLRLVAIIFVYLILCYQNRKEGDLLLNIFEITLIYAVCLIFSGATTAGDRVLIFSLITIIFSRTVFLSTEIRLLMAAIPFVIMNLAWVTLSDQARVNW